MSTQPMRAPPASRHEFRASMRGAMGLVLSLSLLPAGSAFAVGASALQALAVLGASVASGLAIVRLFSAWATKNYDQPLAALIEMAHEMRQGGHGRRMPEGGSPAVCVLTRMLNDAWASVDERTQLSKANLLSVEMQFDRIHSVLQSLVEGVVVVDMHGAVLLANPAARLVLQSVGRPIEGCLLPALVSGDLKDRLAETLAQMSEPTRSRAEVFGLHVGPKVYDVSVARVRSARPDQDFGSVVVLQDVTRNHEIARLKDEFLSSVSHELRTPLTNICAFSEILIQVGPADHENWQEFLKIITEETRRLKKLVDDVLDFSSLEAGRVTLHCERLDVADLVRHAVEQIQPLAHNLGHTIELVSGVQDATIVTDHERLHQVVLRILDNAIKFTPAAGKIRVTIEAVGTQIQITFDDSGRGIPVEQREAVFDKFHQIGNTLTDKPPGQGLSLAICRRILAALGGIIWCDASEFGGARFHIVIPSLDEAGSAIRATEEVASGTSGR